MDNKDCKLSEEDEMIISENVIKTDMDDETLEQKEESNKTEERDEGEENDNNSDFFEERDLFFLNRSKQKLDENELKDIINKTFQDINTVKIGISNPKRPEIVSTKVYDILPNFNDVNVE